MLLVGIQIGFKLSLVMITCSVQLLMYQVHESEAEILDAAWIFTKVILTMVIVTVLHLDQVSLYAS